MSDYKKEVKAGGLKLKNKTLFKADKKKAKVKVNVVVDQSKVDHGGWRRITDEFDLRGGTEVAIETGDSKKRYISALDNGKFTVGVPHTKPAEKPSPEEIFSLIKTPDDTKFSLKTGYNKYVGVDASGCLVAVADAIGSRERFEAVFQDGLSAIQSVSSGLFLSMKTNDEDLVMVCSKTVKEDEIVNLRTMEERMEAPDYTPADDRKTAKDCEHTYQQMYQHSRVITKNRMINYDRNDKSAVKSAQREGNLHEVLLDRRAKQKSDKYC